MSTRQCLLTIMISEAIRSVDSVPAHDLYAPMMARASLDEFQTAINALKRAKLVDETLHVLRWIGPSMSSAKST